VADEYNITTSSVLLLRTEKKRKRIVLQVIKEIADNFENTTVPAEKVSLAPIQQVSPEIQ
jgi:hypothetical protein